MKRDIIIIEDKAVSVTGNDVWMTATEIAGLFHTTVPAVNAGYFGGGHPHVVTGYADRLVFYDDYVTFHGFSF